MEELGIYTLFSTYFESI